MPTNRRKTFKQSIPGGLPVKKFLEQYWQKKPLLVRNAFTGIKSPLTPDELAGLACEPGVNARIVREQYNDKMWCVQNGPFDENFFATLPEHGWSLLVSNVECYIDSALEIQQHFRFIPDWRIDDVMISYAPPGGSVGAHLDSYDVFLLQLQGKRHWAINEQPALSYLADTDLQILSDFKAQQSWTLEPGDMLYLPPGVAHHGIAQDDCMTCSIGFRAPSVRDIVYELDEAVAATVPEQLMYTDPDLEPQKYSAQISAQALNRISDLVGEYVDVEADDLIHIFGEYISSVPLDQIPEQPDTVSSIADMKQALSSCARVCITPCTRLYFIDTNDSALLFANGHSHETSPVFARSISTGRPQAPDDLFEYAQQEQDHDALLALYNEGIVYGCDEND